MKFLFLDNSVDRHLLVQKSIGRNHEVAHSTTVEQAIKFITSSAAVDIALVDQDLGPGRISGITLLNWLHRYVAANKWPRLIMCHTRNCNNALPLVSRAVELGMKATYQPFCAELLQELSYATVSSN